jgi:hypothetical protein
MALERQPVDGSVVLEVCRDFHLRGESPVRVVQCYQDREGESGRLARPPLPVDARLRAELAAESARGRGASLSWITTAMTGLPHRDCMSRIDEAMRRASQAPHTARGHTRGADGSGSLRLADDVTLNEYPLEGRAAARVEMTIASEPRVAAEPRIVTTPLKRQNGPRAKPHSSTNQTESSLSGPLATRFPPSSIVAWRAAPPRCSGRQGPQDRDGHERCPERREDADGRESRLDIE